MKSSDTTFSKMYVLTCELKECLDDRIPYSKPQFRFNRYAACHTA